MKTIILNKPGIRNETIVFDKENETETVLGLVLGNEKGIYELNLSVVHQKDGTKAQILVKGVASKGAVVKINGRVIMEEGLINLDDSLELRVLVLDKMSSALVDPQMEIKSNEVKASHAASVGQIEREKIDYLMSRGVDEDEAKQMIVAGFLKEITDRIAI
jgi:Fe-S cluster assembly protein SufB